MNDFKKIEEEILKKQFLKKKNSIEFLKPIFNKLNNPQNNIGKVIHITGTNGKASVAVLLENILRKSKYKTALYTSPHIMSLRERIKINNENISEKDFCEIYKKVKPFCKDLTFFETMTIIAFTYFSIKKVDVSIIEVGIGGLYDTTNVIESTMISIITSISYDHQDLLGYSLKEIAFQKAGIIKKNSICICPNLNKEALNEIKKISKKQNAKLFIVKNTFKIEKINLIKNEMLMKDLKNKVSYRLNIIGIKQKENLSLVKKTIEVLKEKGFKISNKNFKEGLLNVNILARIEGLKTNIFNKTNIFIIDGAHNKEAIRNLKETIKFLKLKNISFVFDMLSSKNYKEAIKELSTFSNDLIFTKIDNDKALSPFILAQEYSKYKSLNNVYVNQDLKSALILASGLNNIVCVLGSFYLAHEVLELIKENK